MKKEWKIIPSLPSYEVNHLGQVRQRFRKDILKTFLDAEGSLTVNTRQDGCPASRRVARLVGEVFNHGFHPDKRPTYRDGNRANCTPTNLKWVSQSKVTGHPFSRNPKTTTTKKEPEI